MDLGLRDKEAPVVTFLSSDICGYMAGQFVNLSTS
jgi:hypothetical protein